MKKVLSEIQALEKKIAGWDVRVKDPEHTKAEHESKGEHVTVNWEKLIGDSHGSIKNFFVILHKLVGHGVGKVEEVKAGDTLVYFPIAKAGGDIPSEYLTRH